MADAFQVVGAALAVVELSLKIYRELTTFIDRAKQADLTSEDLILKVQRFRKTVQIVHLTLAGREKVHASQRESHEERRIRSNILESLEGWNTTLSEFETGIPRLRPTPGQDSRVGWINKTLHQLKLDRKTPWIGKLEIAIDSYMDEISLSLNCLQILLQGETSSKILRLYVRLEQRLERLTGANTTHHPVPFAPTTQPQNWPANGETIGKCIEVACSIRSRSSVCSGDAESLQLRRDGLATRVEEIGLETETVTQDSTEDNEFDDLISLAAPRSHSSSTSSNLTCYSELGLEDDDPTPEFDDVTPQEVLDALIQNYGNQAQIEIRDLRHDEAEENQRKMIICALERNLVYGNCYNIQETKMTLVDILMKKNDPRSLQEAIDINRSLFRSTPPTTPEIPQIFPTLPRTKSELLVLSKINFQRAELEYKRFCNDLRNTKALEASEKFAKRSFKLTLSLKGEVERDFVRFVEHLIKVYEHKRDKVALETYRDLYLNSSVRESQSASPISPVTHKTKFSQSPQSIHASISPKGFGNLGHIDSSDRPDLISAILEKDRIKVELLLHHGANPDEVFQDKSPLMYAIESGVEEIILHLKNKGAGINSKVKGRTPLIHAIKERLARMVEYLCELGVDVEASVGNNTPLLCAAYLKYPEIVRTLCQHKAKINARCSSDLTVLHCAISSEYNKSRNDVREVLEILLNYNADPNAKDGEGKTPLHHAIQESDKACVKFMLTSSRGFDLEAQDDYGRTPLYTAAYIRQTDLVQLCLDYNANIPNALPQDTTKYIRDLIERKRRSSTASSPAENGSLHASGRGSLRRAIIVQNQKRPPLSSDGTFDESCRYVEPRVWMGEKEFAATEGDVGYEESTPTEEKNRSYNGEGDQREERETWYGEPYPYPHQEMQSARLGLCFRLSPVITNLIPESLSILPMTAGEKRCP